MLNNIYYTKQSLQQRLAMNKILKTLGFRTIYYLNSRSFYPALKFFYATSPPNSSYSNENQASLKRRKDSQWIYSTKHQEKQFRKPGTISIYTHINSDTHNASLRLVEHLEKANIIFTNQVTKVRNFLQAISNKQQYAYEAKKQTDNQKSLKPFTQFPNSLVELKQGLNKNSQTLQFNTEIQISKHIQLEKDIKKESGEKINAELYEQSLQLKKYMNTKNLETALNQIKNKQGFPAVFQLNAEKQQKEQQEISKLCKDGFNVMYLFEAESDKVCQSGQIIKQLQDKGLSYEILPCTGEMVEAIVSSGLPADRFCVQVPPNSEKAELILEQILLQRKSMKITACFKINTEKLDDFVKAVIKILGKQHIIYLHSKTDYFLGEAAKLSEILSDLQSPISKSLKLLYCYVVLAPYISQFNIQLKNQMNIETHIRGELQSDKINAVEMQILVKKLEQMQQKNQIYQVNVVLMVAQMLSRLKDEQKVRKSLKILFPRKKPQWFDRIIKQGASKIVVDHIGLKRQNN